MELANQRLNNVTTNTVIAGQRDAAPERISGFIHLLIVKLQLFLVLRVAVANHADRRHPHPQQIGIALGGVSLEIAVQDAVALSNGQLIIRAGKMIHTDKLIAGVGE